MLGKGRQLGREIWQTTRENWRRKDTSEKVSSVCVLVFTGLLGSGLIIGGIFGLYGVDLFGIHELIEIPSPSGLITPADRMTWTFGPLMIFVGIMSWVIGVWSGLLMKKTTDLE